MDNADKKAALKSFAPSFSGSTVDPFTAMCGAAFKAATDETAAANIYKVIDAAAPDELKFVFESIETAALDWFQFGHLPKAPGSLSGVCPYRLTVQFTTTALSAIELTLHLLNPRFIFVDGGYAPATIGADFSYAVAGTATDIGLVVSASKTSTGSTDQADIYRELAADLPSGLAAPGPGWNDFDQNNLVGRIDLSMAWQAGSSGKFPKDGTGKAKSKVTATTTGGSDGTRLALYGLGVATGFNGLLHESERIGLRIEAAVSNKATAIIVLGDHSGLPAAEGATLKKALHEFGLQSDFRGVVFTAIEAHWLDDSAMGATITETKAAIAAVSFQEKASLSTPARIYASFAFKVDPTNNDSYLRLLDKGAQMTLVVAGTKLRTATLSATFAKSEAGANPYSWLSQKKVAISISSIAVNDGAQTRTDYAVDVSFDGDDKATPLATLRAADLGLTATDFTYLASLLTLAPIFVVAGKVTSTAKPGDKRVRLVEVSSGAALGATFGTAALAGKWFFKEALEADELRVTGARILSQEDADGTRQTALLFDVETAFAFHSDGNLIKTAKAFSVRIENTGILYAAGKFRWVQALQGMFGVTIADASSWDFGALAGLLKIKAINLKLADGDPNLGLTIQMALNLGVVTAKDFRIEFSLASPAQDLTIYPSTIEVNIPGVLKGTGELNMGQGHELLKDVSGKLDVALLASGLRMSGAARVTHFQDDEAHSHTAFAAGAKVQFTPAIPLLDTGLGVGGFEALYASHFVRVEDPEQDGVPPSLQWLQKANGEVAIDSIANKQLWKPVYDKWSYGLGMVLVLEAEPDLLNLNAMLVLDVPGPKITIFANVVFLEEAEDNETKAKSGGLDHGMFGILQIDIPSHLLTLGALVDYDFDFIKLYGAIENQYCLSDLTDWHLYIGHFNRPISAVLKLSDFINEGMSGYFMAAGKEIAGVPRGSKGEVDLPGLALALGAGAYVHLGGGGLYISVSLHAFLDVSLSKSIYVIGGLELDGELFVFIAGIGTSALLSFEFYQDSQNTFLQITGAVCGSIKIGFLKLKGCVTATIGAGGPTQIAIPPLVAKFSIVSGTNVALLGQGSAVDIDASLGSVAPGDTGSLSKVPLDAVLVFSLAAGPALLPGAAGFTAQLNAAVPDPVFHYGNQAAGYQLGEVSLKKKVNGAYAPIDYGAASAVWWRNVQKPGNHQPLAMQLALLTRRPFAAQNAVPSASTMHRWIDALLGEGGLCDTVPPQAAVETLPVSATAQIDAAKAQTSWLLAGRYKDPATESALSPSQPGAMTIRVDRRSGYGSPEDRFAGYPAYLCRKIIDTDAANHPFACLAVSTMPVALDGAPTVIHFDCAGLAPPELGQPTKHLLELLVATTEPLNAAALQLNLENGGPVPSQFTVELLADPSDFDEHWSNWQAMADPFLGLGAKPGYGQLSFARIIVDLGQGWNAGDPPRALTLQWRPSSKYVMQTMYIGATKFLPIEELARQAQQAAHNSGVLNELKAYLAPELVPILEPMSDYEVAVAWRTTGAATPAGATDTFTFSTTADPPRRLAPYLLGTFPAAGETLHPVSLQPGFSLASGDALRILQKFPGLRLKIVVLEDGGNPVLGRGTDGKEIKWSDGVTYEPAILLDALSSIPTLDRTWFDALPSPLLSALKAAIAAGKLNCLDNTLPLEQGLWIGLKLDLQPLLGYTVRVSLVDANNGDARWTYHEPSDDEGLAFLEWHFQCALNPSLAAQAAAFAARVPGRRALLPLTAAPAQDLQAELSRAARPTVVCDEFASPNLAGVVPAPASTDEVALISDQLLEDALARWTGERSPLNDEMDVTILHDAGGGPAVAVFVRSAEPFLRRTATAKLAELDTDAGSAQVLTLDDIITRYPCLRTSRGISALFVSTGGTTAVAFLAAGPAPRSAVIAANEYAPHYLPYAGASGVVDLVSIAGGM